MQQERAEAGPGAPRSGLTVLELVTAAAIMSVLMGLLLPAVNCARETARRMRCTSHLRQIGLALHAYHDLNGGLPAGGRREASGKTVFGWATAILPELEESGIAVQLDLQQRVDSRRNAGVRATTPPVFLCPSDISQRSFALFREHGAGGRGGADSVAILARLPRANYVGIFGTSDPDDVPGPSGEGAFPVDWSIRFGDLERGLSHTFLVGERTARKLPSTWLGVLLGGEDALGRIVGNANRGPNRDDADECELDSRHPGCVNLLWADGHVQPIFDGIDPPTYRRLARRR